MKIEKVSENQIRCTLTKEDLADRKLQISELAYGTESARALFREMMQQAAYQYGFEADDIPLMIEAVPMSADSIVLIITKVEYPEELDTRFSKFSNPGSEDGFDAFSDDAASTSASASGTYRSTINSVPFPSSLFTEIVPPIMSTRLFTLSLIHI